MGIKLFINSDFLYFLTSLIYIFFAIISFDYRTKTTSFFYWKSLSLFFIFAALRNWFLLFSYNFELISRFYILEFCISIICYLLLWNFLKFYLNAKKIHITFLLLFIFSITLRLLVPLNISRLINDILLYLLPLFVTIYFFKKRCNNKKFYFLIFLGLILTVFDFFSLNYNKNFMPTINMFFTIQKYILYGKELYILFLLLFTTIYSIKKVYYKYQNSLKDTKEEFILWWTVLIFNIIIVLGFFILNYITKSYFIQMKDDIFIKAKLSYNEIKQRNLVYKHILNNLSEVITLKNNISDSEVIYKIMNNYKKNFNLNDLYFIDSNGILKYSTDKNIKDSILNKDYKQRLYFKNALKNNHINYYFICDKTLKDKNLYISKKIIKDNVLLGIMVIKNNINHLISDIINQDVVFIVNKQNIIIYSNLGTTLNRPLFKLSETVKQTLLKSKQFSLKNLTPVIKTTFKNDELIINNHLFVYFNYNLFNSSDYKLYLLHNIDSSKNIRLIFFLILTLIIIILLIIEYVLAYVKTKKFNEKIQKINEELSFVNEELKTLDKTKNNILSNISHELRTPLVAIQGYVEMINMERLGPVTDKQKDKLKIIISKVKKLTELINQLLVFSDVNKEEISLILQKTNINDLVNITVLDFQSFIEKQNIIVEKKLFAENLIIKIDRNRILQVFDNLLSNAIKFANKSKTSMITIETKKDDKYVIISFIDNGVGIKKKNIDKVFTKFFQADNSTTRKYEGMGIGLSLCKKIIELHNGIIEVKTQEGEGSTFTIKLPIKFNL